MREYQLKDRPKTVPSNAALNDEQRRVVEAGGGPILVIAGAGSGKTRALTYRAARLLESVPPERLLLLTFTNKAAREMTARIARLVPAAIERLWSGTFHAIAHRILRQYAERLGYGANYGVLDPEEAKDLMELAVSSLDLDVTAKRLPKAPVLLGFLSNAVNTDRTLAEVLRREAPQFLSLHDTLEQILRAYLARKIEMNLMDFDDLLVNLRLLLEDCDDVRAELAERFLHVLVDEYQDTNRLQAAICALLSSHHHNLTVVGDDCQSIYAFRGADVGNILRFPEVFSGAQVFRLETCYRSTPQILALANASIQHNRQQFPKQLKAMREDGERPALVHIADEADEAAFVAQRVLELRDEGIELKRQVVLYRAHYQSMELQVELQRRGIPFVVRSGPRFFEQAHIRDVLAHLKILHNPLDRLAWTRVLLLQDGIGARHAHRIMDALAEQGDPFAALAEGKSPQGLPARARQSLGRLRALLLKLAEPALSTTPGALLESILAAGYEAHVKASYPNADTRIDDLRQLSHFASRFPDYAAFLEDLALVEGLAAETVGQARPSDEYLLLSTVHQAKGLEWDAVYVLGLADGQFPLRRALMDEAGEAEERRLFYVAVTRARNALYLCLPLLGADRERHKILNRPSRFLAELPHTRSDLLETWRVS